MTATDATDYSLTGASSRTAIEEGLAEGAWFRPPIDPDRLAALQQRTNGRAAVELALWLTFLAGSAALAIALWPSPLALPALLVYGGLYGGSADARWHEMGHNTAFKTQWVNDVVYRLSSFMLWREATVWRWSHDRHHTDTIVVGRDMEIAFQRPTSRRQLVKTFSGVGALSFWPRILRHAGGGRDREVAAFMPESEWPAVHREARQYVAIQGLVIIACFMLWTPLPLLLVGLPTVYGMWLMVFFGITQHAGLQENVLDHRLNTRTVYMNPVFRFLYLNMNYHIEHHMFPTVPYYNLPALHAEVKPFLPEPVPNTMAAYRELLGAMSAQRTDPAFELNRPVPEVPTAEHQRISIAGNGPVVTREGDVVWASTLGLDVGRVRRLDVGSSSFALFRLGKDEYVVTDGFCTHGQAHLADGVVLDCELIECPKHNGQFDIRSGAPKRRPVSAPLKTYPVELGSDGRSARFSVGDSSQNLR